MPDPQTIEQLGRERDRLRQGLDWALMQYREALIQDLMERGEFTKAERLING